MILIIISVSVFACTKKSADDVQPNGAGSGGNAIGSCDSSNVTFSGTVVPILSANCSACHSGSTPSSGVGLETYSQVSAQANNGTLYGVISHSPGYNPMPQGGAMLSACDIGKIRKWIHAGAPNN
jgi:hypothetical protein